MTPFYSQSRRIPDLLLKSVDTDFRLIDAWQTMAKYAIGRASDSNQNRRQGNLLQTMLGAPNENDEDTINYMKSKYLLLLKSNHPIDMFNTTRF